MKIAYLLLATLLAGPASAASPTDEARRFFEAGGLAYRAGRYEHAVQAFEQAYARVSKPAIAFSLAQAHRRRYFAGGTPANAKRALDLFRTYVTEVRSGKRRPDAVEQIQALEIIVKGLVARTATVSRVRPSPTQLVVYSTAPGARASVDGAPMADVPVIATVSPGRHEVRVAARGYASVRMNAVAVAERIVPVEVTLAPKPARLTVESSVAADLVIDSKVVGATPIATPIELSAGTHELAVLARGHRPFVTRLDAVRDGDISLDVSLEQTFQRRFATVCLWVSGALVVGAGTSAIVSVVSDADARSYVDGLGAQPQDADALSRYQDARTRRNTSRTAAFVLGASAVAVGGVGAVLYFWDTPQGSKGVGLSGRF